MEKVSPLFRIPSCVFYAERYDKKSTPINNLDGIVFTGKLPEHNCNYFIAKQTLKEEPVKYFYKKQGNASAISTKKSRKSEQLNPYKKNFKQGATIVPRCFYFIEIDQEIPTDFEDRVMSIKTSETIEADAKKPWKGLKFKGKIESRFFFRTSLSKSILPFALYNPDFVVLPIVIELNQHNEKEIKLQSSKELRQESYLNAAKWFSDCENTWQILRTEKNKNISSINYLNWRNKIVEQNLNAQFLVLYNASAKDANAVVVSRKDYNFEFIVESKAYWLATNKPKEAFYLSSILNSSILNERIKEFQTRGLFGVRDIHKKILDIYFPRFDESNEVHLNLASLGETAHKKAAIYLENNPPQKVLTANHLGRLRLGIKKHLADEMKEIDKLVKKVVG